MLHTLHFLYLVAAEAAAVWVGLKLLLFHPPVPPLLQGPPGPPDLHPGALCPGAQVESCVLGTHQVPVPPVEPQPESLDLPSESQSFNLPQMILIDL